MSTSWVTTIGLLVGLLLAGWYVWRTTRAKKQPEFATAATCVMTGGGFVVGPLLIYGIIDRKMIDQHLQPVHIAIAGLAVLWLSVQFVASLRK